MRVFVVGNGPSLNETPLELLRDEISWGVNRIHLIYPRTEWRPTHITFAEMTAGGAEWFPKIWESVKANPQAKRYARDDAWWWTDEMPDDVVRFNACTHHDLRHELPGEEFDKVPDDWHFPQICKFGGSIPMTIQLAVQEGFDPVYLIGCDLGHKAGSSNHFDSNYGASSGAADNLNIDARTAWKRRTANAMAHALIARVSPVPIYNATVGGTLEAYPRVEFESLFD